ncbi:MAG: MATE family efflux transporter [Lachnospiraceae bacterium]|jgi:putative MATE family efflux protein
MLHQEEHDFTKGTVKGNILQLALPMMLAQLINIFYNIVDRMYIGRIPGAGSLALTGLGVVFPIISAVLAFANLFGYGGPPLCSIARGKQDEKRAAAIMGNTFSMLVITGVVITAVGFLVKKPLLYTFGASANTYSYANEYLRVYLLGTVFVMISVGMNGFINSQGFARKGMLTVLIGAVLNIILDPIFIFVLHMGAGGAALATVISQMVSACWVLVFLRGKKTLLRLDAVSMKLDFSLMKQITAMGLSGFFMAFTNSAVQVVCNVMLQLQGGDVYVGVMAIIYSVREVLCVPLSGFTSGAQPVLGYNYGAKAYSRVKEGIRFLSLIGIVYTMVVWLITLIFPWFFIWIFNGGPDLMEAGVICMRIYFFAFVFMSLQFAGQSTFTALGKAKHAIFFSLLRKVVIVIPLTIGLPYVANLGIYGVFLAEPVSNLLGGCACFFTMLFVTKKILKEE